VRSRHARVIAVATVNGGLSEKFVDDMITVPDVHPALQPIVATIPVQLFAYYVAKFRGCDIDRPRNLAKSVTLKSWVKAFLQIFLMLLGKACIFDARVDDPIFKYRCAE
jgi:hypothetical protein